MTDLLEDELDVLAAREPASNEEAFGMLATATAFVSQRITALGEPRRMVEETYGTRLAESEPRIRKWVDRLREIAEKVAKKTGAKSFSLTVGMPAGASVTLSWDIE